EVVEGAKNGVAINGLNFAAETTHKGDEADFVGSLSKLKAADCQIVVMALGVRQSITVVGTAKKMSLTGMKFLNTSAGFLTVVAKVPGGVTEGLYASSGWQDLSARAAEPVPAKFIAEYTAEYGKAPSGFAMIGYSAAEQVVRALEAAGKELTNESFIAGMETLDFKSELMASQITYGANDHQGADGVVISVVEGGSWKFLTEQ
ncbi:MAG: ABC transporter substrate-binding protein, partial [Marinosulfonomonas sp.]|nr:ABC transporter substrate-binding protein [Marinosulfonomonas sp.]